ncbi:MAG: murein transglycosylase A [Caulobacter sp.]|jgi:membrane-bound lytic murein transglycosylase A
MMVLKVPARMGPMSAAPLLAALLFLAACATTPPSPSPQPPPQPTPGPTRPEPPLPAPPVPQVEGLSLAELPGWAADDHAAALTAVVASCRGRPRPQMRLACARVLAAGPLTGEAARLLLEDTFRAVPVGQTGLLTAYFSPVYEARFSRTGEFTAPVRPRPDDLVIRDPGQPDPSRPGWKGEGRMVGGELRPYPDRAAIEAREETRPLAWMRAEDLFFLQIQGSGVLVLPDGRRKRAVFAATNGLPFRGIAIPMRDRGLLPENGTSGEAIRAWLADNRGPRADEIMQLNPRYVFFRMEDDDGGEPSGAAGIPLPAGRAIAVDPSHHSYGDFYWIDGQAPSLAGAFPRYSRLVAALDTGGAIRGQVRADLYLGRGDAAGREAGRVKHDLRMWRLIPAPAYQALP